MEDAVTFLEGLTSVYPDVPALLSNPQVLALDMDPKEPFDESNVNEGFVRMVEGYFLTKHSIHSAKSVLRVALLEPHNKGDTVDTKDQELVISCLEKIQARIKGIWEAKIVLTEETKGEAALPRIIRLCRKLNLTEKETTVMLYTLVWQVAESRGGGGGGGYMRGGMASYGASSLLFGSSTLSVCKACDISISDMMKFLGEDRDHMKQGIFLDVQQSYLLHSNISFDEAMCRALIGAPFSDNEFLKIEHTPLAAIITGEEGSSHIRTQDITQPETHETQNKAADTRVLSPTVIPPPPTEPGSVDGEVKQPDNKEPEAAAPVPDKPKKPEISDLDDLLRLEREKEKGTDTGPVDPDTTMADEDVSAVTPYKTDLEYLDDHFQLVAQRIKVKSMDARMDLEAQYGDEIRDTRTIRQKREAESKAKVMEKKCAKRLALTMKAGTWMPRLERMAKSRNLCPFEKNVLLSLIGFVIQPNKISTFEGLNMGFGASNTSFTVGELLRLFCVSLKDQIKHRMYFYKTGSLVREGMIVVHNSGLTGDPTSAKVEIDRRMLDFCVGLDTEFSEMVEGSHLYYPKTKFDQVVLSKEQKSLILNTVSNFESFKRCRKQMGLDDAITYGAGMVMLFYGPPGTGKTMMANALANKLSKKVLLINFPSLGSMSAGENFKFIFREAKINDAILFFDECEAIFESREKGGHDVNLLLTEIERHDGLIVMATNRPYDLDEAMHRRIMIAIEFLQPDHILRKAIWENHIPEQMKLAEDVDMGELSLRFELTGGFIKNAVLSALSIAVSRDGDSPLVTQDDLLKGANLQLRGRLRMKDFHRRIVPKSGLDKVIVIDQLSRTLDEIVQFEKARSVLFGQWGFAANEQQGITVLLHGPPGTGKTLAAEALGYEVGKPLKVVNCGELLSKWVGESSKNIDAIFEEARHSDAILVFDEAEGLFGSRTEMSTSTDRYANVDVGVLLYHIERFPGIIILTTNLIENIDKAFFRRLKFVLEFEIPPSKLRARMWKLLIPKETPLTEDIDFDRLARFEMSGGNIKSAIFRAASRAALRKLDNRILKMKDLEDAAEEEMGKSSTRTSFRRQDSGAASMFN